MGYVLVRTNILQWMLGRYWCLLTKYITYLPKLDDIPCCKRQDYCINRITTLVAEYFDLNALMEF